MEQEERETGPISLRRAVISRMKKVIDLYAKDPKTTYLDIIELTKCCRKTVERDVTRLKKFGVLKKHGNTRNAYWLVDREIAAECGL